MDIRKYILLILLALAGVMQMQAQADLPYRRRIRFARTGDYCITVTPGRPVKGIEAVGINIVKSE